MSISDCSECWTNPCRCGYDYRMWSKEDLANQLSMLKGMLDGSHEYSKFKGEPNTPKPQKHYVITKEGSWRYKILDTSTTHDGVGPEVVLVTHSKVVADICEKALNDNETKKG